MLVLTLTAELSNVTDLKFTDSLEEPYDFSMKLVCTSCREEHPNWVTINQHEIHQVSGSRGEASFVFKCKNCKRESTANLKLLNRPYLLEDSGKPVNILQLDTRGIEFVKFRADGKFQCKGAESNTVFNEVDLEDDEWYDYDEKAGEEVSITDIKWEFNKSSH